MEIPSINPVSSLARDNARSVLKSVQSRYDSPDISISNIQTNLNSGHDNLQAISNCPPSKPRKRTAQQDPSRLVKAKSRMQKTVQVPLTTAAKTSAKSSTQATGKKRMTLEEKRTIILKHDILVNQNEFTSKRAIFKKLGVTNATGMNLLKQRDELFSIESLNDKLVSKRTKIVNRPMAPVENCLVEWMEDQRILGE